MTRHVDVHTDLHSEEGGWSSRNPICKAPTRSPARSGSPRCHGPLTSCSYVAATPSVNIVDQLPMTAVGKPYKLPLRADAVCRAVQEALDQFGGAHEVIATADGGSIVVTVTLDPAADEAALGTVLDRYAIAWVMKERP